MVCGHGKDVMLNNILAILLAAVVLSAVIDPRVGTEISPRKSSTVAAFKRLYPCPETGLSTGACPGWQVDHVIPLACKGKDEVGNMQWLPVEIKTCAGTICKDRWERKIYCK